MDVECEVASPMRVLADLYILLLEHAFQILVCWYFFDDEIENHRPYEKIGGSLFSIFTALLFREELSTQCR